MEEKVFKQRPYDISDFKRIITENYVYVDKTQFIEEMEDAAIRNNIFIRPKGFGKSLFVSMLENYYDINTKNEFEQLFGNLFIGQHPTPERNSYAVLKFDFSEIPPLDEEGFSESFSRNIYGTVRDFLHKYSNLFKTNIPLPDDIDRHGLGALDTAIFTARMNKVRIYLLVDEYDCFARDVIIRGRSWNKNVDFYMKYKPAYNFYLRIKSAENDLTVSRTFITGITSAMYGEVASILHTENLSRLSEYNEMRGFTKDELDYVVRETGFKCLDERFELKMKWHYGGYLFHENGGNRLYIPSLVFYSFTRGMHIFHSPYINKDVIHSYSILDTLMQDKSNYATMLYISKHNIIDSDFNYAFPINMLSDRNYLVQLFFSLGLLTIDKKDHISYRLKFPNSSARAAFNHYIYAKREREYAEKIVFLDIDGVLQPYTQKRFDHLEETDELNRQLLEKYNVDYSLYDLYDVGAVYYDWDITAVAELKRILDTTGAKIVISSDWRDKTIDRMVDLCRIHNLDDYIVGATTTKQIEPDVKKNKKYNHLENSRSVEILMYLEAHPGVKNYVVIDDMNLVEDFGEQHAIKTVRKLTSDDADKCIELLSQENEESATVTKKRRIRQEWLNSLTDQTQLLDIAKNDSDKYIRSAAVKKLTDQTQLFDIAKDDSEKYIRILAVRRLTDQTLLANIAKKYKEWIVCKVAVEQLTDQTLLADIAKNNNISSIRKIAVGKLTNRRLLREVAEKYLEDIDMWHYKIYDSTWQKVEALIDIANKFPEVLKKNWERADILIKGLHEYTPNDEGDKDNGTLSYQQTATSRGLIFPPYPFDS
jgi:hypothetical protein